LIILLVNRTDALPKSAAVVFNPVSGASSGRVAADRRRIIRAVLVAHKIRTLWYETSKDDTGHGCAQDAINRGVEVLLVSGGDGTVMACASSLIGTSVPLAIIPTGTANVIAARLRIPDSMVNAIEVALRGNLRSIDLGTSASDHTFFTTSIGFGAAVMRDAIPGLKARVGFLAYVFAAVEHVLDPPANFRIIIDGQPPIAEKANAILVGNLGQLMTNPEILQLTLDDGLLEVGILRILPLSDWLHLGMPVFLSSRRKPLYWYQARHVLIDCDRPQPIEKDGDWMGSSSSLEVQVLPRSLKVCVPGSADLSRSVRFLRHSRRD
jgi:diacylglycerol kinase (ATP)